MHENDDLPQDSVAEADGIENDEESNEQELDPDQVREDMFVDAPEELNFDIPSKEALTTDDNDNGDQFNNEKEDREKELAVLQEQFKLLIGENDLKGEDENTVEIVSPFSKFLKTAEEEKIQHEDALRELREIISGKDDEIDDLPTKISELSSSQLVSGHQSQDEEQLEATTYRIMLTLSNVFGQEELQYGSSCRQSTSVATICPCNIWIFPRSNTSLFS